jgi:hypothetical protein
MNRLQPRSYALAALFLLASLHTDHAGAQQKTLKEQLVGTWLFVSTTVKLADGSPVYGPNPKGLLIITENGFYSSHILRADVPRFAANSRLQGTPEENKAAVQGSIASRGRYTVNEANKSITIRFEASTYPNNTGIEQTRPLTITGDDLKIINPGSSTGEQSELIYKRAK